MSAAQTQVVDALQLSLLLAYAQEDLYTRGIAAAGLVPTSDVAMFTAMRDHARAHVTMLQTLVGGRGATPNAKPAFDFTAKGAAKDSSGAAFGFQATPAQYALFVALSQAFADLSVRACKGQLVAMIADKPALTTVLTIHSVEARHASQARRLRGKKGWITGSGRDGLPDFLQPVYDGEDAATQAGIDLAGTSVSGGGIAAATEAFDEPLTKDQATAVVTLFIA